ncbi:MAG: RdgB/HAM1 family non-canonical purine NTP pyrophosphatase [Paludibacteraceae bacterium]|jgi:XTP/dITP diphosphohydrolase|nr:RdgB/HAM1 family non-canonical purine NTP pyrophosphatase [Paludibacteraceae bacterium]
MKNLVFATGNIHKLQEVQGLFKEGFALSCLKDVNITEEIPETADNLVDNALQKARYVYEKCGIPCFADDTGLEVDALDGAPGVYSARYAGEQKDSKLNMLLLLKNMNGQTNRNARFRTIIAYIDENAQEHIFEGEIKGKIIENMAGENGFGYDPIFVPEGYEETFAELSSEVKNTISHRARAMEKFLSYINNK